MKEIDKIIKKLRIIYELKDEEVIKEEIIELGDEGAIKEETGTYLISAGKAIPLEKLGDAAICEICGTIEIRGENRLVCNNCGLSLCLKCARFYQEGEKHTPLCPRCYREFQDRENLWLREDGLI